MWILKYLFEQYFPIFQVATVSQSSPAPMKQFSVSVESRVLQELKVFVEMADEGCSLESPDLEEGQSII